MLPSAASLPAGDTVMVTVGRVSPSVCAAAKGASIAAASTARLVVPIRPGMSRLPDFEFRATLCLGVSEISIYVSYISETREMDVQWIETISALALTAAMPAEARAVQALAGGWSFSPEKRRVGKGCVSTGRSRCGRYM